MIWLGGFDGGFWMECLFGGLLLLLVLALESVRGQGRERVLRSGRRTGLYDFELRTMEKANVLDRCPRRGDGCRWLPLERLSNMIIVCLQTERIG